MKVALVTTPKAVRSGIGDYTRHLLPYLREHCEVDLYVPAGMAGEEEDGEPLFGVDALDPRAYDQLVYQLGNEVQHAFMARLVRRLGGTVVQHDWVLFDLALAAFPALVRGGLKGHLLALREGGPAQTRIYLESWLRRRRERNSAQSLPELGDLSGELLAGWHEPEPTGRWTADRAAVRLAGRGVERATLGWSTEQGRRLSVELHPRSGAPRVLVRDQLRDGVLELAFDAEDDPILVLDCAGITVTDEQRRHGDARRLGCFVQGLEWRGAEGVRELDLSAPAALALRPHTLSDERFRLPLNRSIVRHADCFIVHSEYVKQLVLRERNAHTPIAVVPHGAERRWEGVDRAAARQRLGLSQPWREGFLITAFGGIQRHKRIDKLMEAVALARRSRDDVRLLLAGGYHVEDFDPAATARRLGVEDAVDILGYVSEQQAWDCIAAGDLSVNLRGPSSGGTSGGIYQSLAFGRPVIATGAAEQAELPGACIPKVPIGEGEVPALAQLLVELRDDPERRARMEQASRDYVDQRCHWSHIARRYAEVLDAMPGPRVTRKSLIAQRLAEAKHKRARS